MYRPPVYLPVPPGYSQEEEKTPGQTSAKIPEAPESVEQANQQATTETVTSNTVVGQAPVSPETNFDADMDLPEPFDGEAEGKKKN